MPRKIAGCIATSCVGLGLTGCGGAPPSCTTTLHMLITPSSATADHAANAPGNQAKFTAEASPSAPPGCPVPAYILPLRPAWTNPDPTDIQISSANDPTNGAATCVAATNGPVTLTAVSGSGTNALQATATLTCK